MIQIADLQGTLRIPRRRIRKLVEEILRGEGKPEAAVSFAFVSSSKMRSLNLKYLRHEGDTDVLAFPLPLPMLGEVVVSTEYARREARARKISAREEVLRYAAHGLLHLLGYDDHTPRAKRRMWAKQEAYLAKIMII